MCWGTRPSGKIMTNSATPAYPAGSEAGGQAEPIRLKPFAALRQAMAAAEAEREPGREVPASASKILTSRAAASAASSTSSSAAAAPAAQAEEARGPADRASVKPRLAART